MDETKILITIFIYTIFISVFISLIYTIFKYITIGRTLEKKNRNSTYQSNSIFLSGGKYIGGRDIPIGRYDIFIISGYGRISSNNPDFHATFTKGRNYNDYKNIEIREGTSLEIDVKLRIRLYNKREILSSITSFSGSVQCIKLTEEKTSTTNFEIETMNGWQFEEFCADVLRKIGYENVEVTKGSGDQGVDILAERDGIKYAIQCKKYSQPVGNHAVQQIYSGMKFYHCHVGVIMTNNYFTKSAKELSKENGIILWDRDFLYKYISNSVEEDIEKN